MGRGSWTGRRCGRHRVERGSLREVVARTLEHGSASRMSGNRPGQRRNPSHGHLCPPGCRVVACSNSVLRGTCDYSFPPTKYMRHPALDRAAEIDLCCSSPSKYFLAPPAKHGARDPGSPRREPRVAACRFSITSRRPPLVQLSKLGVLLQDLESKPPWSVPGIMAVSLYDLFPLQRLLQEKSI